MSTTLLLVFDLVGVFVFALSGATAGVAKKLDVFGVVVVGVVSAIGGGVLRDLLIGDTPPFVLRDWRYLAVPTAASVVVFFFHPQVSRLRRLVLLSDAAGLGLFVVSGTVKALAAGVPASGACAAGLLTGIGGGVLRDVLTGEIPVVLRREVYALAALLGAVTVVVADGLGVEGLVSGAFGAALVFGLRVLALVRRWSVPVPRDVAGH
ncbi:MAG TPA: trimeric intracellular cation channel family protein [Mycobacteriales bacterium]|nr:trimeric intracellular cation channel family protein [Mycobacteriales bacterium]